MSRLHVRIQIQFPYIKVLVLGILISLLGLGEVVIGILAFTHKIWGHYLGTGLWCGILIFVSGICAIITSQIRAPLFAKIYFATSVVGMLVSFVMLILSSGGLDYDSNFYHFHHFNPSKHIRKHNSTVMVHGLALGFSICSFLANIVSVIICMKYVVFDKKIKYATERTTRKTTNSLQRCVLRGETTDIRSSTCSRAPLAERSSRRNRPRRTNDQGSRRRSEAEEFIPGESRSDSTRRNKERRRRSRREERREQAENRPVRGTSSRNEQSRNRRNEMPVPVQVERMTIYDGVVEADIVHNDLLPTHFNEDELPPYEEAIRDTYVPVSDLNNQVFSINAQNEFMRTNAREQIHVCDIDEDKIYQNVNCCNVEENELQQCAPVIEQEPTVRAGSSRGREIASNAGDNVNLNNSSTAVKNKACSRVKNIQEERQNETNEEIELYVNQSAVPKKNKRCEKTANRDKASLSTSALCDKSVDVRPQTRRCASTASSVSLPPGYPPQKPPRFYSARSDLRDIFDSSRSDSSLGINVHKGIIADKSYMNVDDINILPKQSGPKLRAVMKVENSGLDCRNKNSRYKADYIQLQIRQEPEGSSCSSVKEASLSSVSSSKPGNKFETALAHSSPRSSPITRNSVKTPVSCNPSSERSRSYHPPKDLGLISVSKSASPILKVGMLDQKGYTEKVETKSHDDAMKDIASPVTPASPASMDWSYISPLRFGSPTSAFKPYRRGDSSSSSGFTSPMSDSDVLNSPTRKPGTDVSAIQPPAANKAVERPSSWKEFMLPSPHFKTYQDLPADNTSNARKLSAVVSQPSKPESPEMSMNTFPRPTPPRFIIPPLSSMRNASSSGPSTSVTVYNSRLPFTSGASPSMQLNTEPYVVLPSSSSSGHQLGTTSSSSKSSNPGQNSVADTNPPVLTSSNNGLWSSRTGASASNSLFQPRSSSSTSSNRNFTHDLFRPSISTDAQNSRNAVAKIDYQTVNNPAVGGVRVGGVSGVQTLPSQSTGAQGPSQVQSLQLRDGQAAHHNPPTVRLASNEHSVAPAQGQVNPSPQQQGRPQQQQGPLPRQQQQQQQQQQGKPLFSILL